jgi:trk system potassium uptake protein TrkA
MNVKIIERDAARCDKLNELLAGDSTMVIHGDGRDLGLLEEEGIANTQGFVALTGNAETNILACLTAKKLGVRKTIAMVENLDYVSMAESLDIGTIINKKTVAASHIFQMMLRADVRNMRSLMMVDSDVAEFVAAEGSRVTRKPVKDLGLPFGVTIGGLVRNGEGMLVSGSSQILPGDSVMVFCHEHKLGAVEKYFKKTTLW